uniref:Uncharacterized protein n=1 Tax=Anopheles aquasalis TaxID=42839 RepID=T1DQP8_ANOAQ
MGSWKFKKSPGEVNKKSNSFISLSEVVWLSGLVVVECYPLCYRPMLDKQVFRGKRLCENFVATEPATTMLPTERITVATVTVALVAPMETLGDADGLPPMATVGMVCVCLPVGFQENHIKTLL